MDKVGDVSVTKGVSLTDRIEVPTQRTITDSGQMIVPCAFARIGAQAYMFRDIGIDKDGTVMVNRSEAEVFNDASMNSFRSVPVTVGHPTSDGQSISVTSKNSKDLQVGSLEGMPVRDEDLLKGTLVIARQDAIDSIEEGTVELSAGYTCDIIMVGDEYHQTNIRANHIAIVAKGRAGANCMIADEEVKVGQEKDKEGSDLGLEGNGVHSNLGDSSQGKELNDKETGDKRMELEALQLVVDKQEASIDDLKAKLEAAELATVELKDSIDGLVEARLDVVTVAAKLTAIDSFAGKTVLEIKGMVVADALKMDITDRSDAYVEARFDILREDKGVTVADMMTKQVTDASLIAPTAYVDPMVAKRLEMIARNSK